MAGSRVSGQAETTAATVPAPLLPVHTGFLTPFLEYLGVREKHRDEDKNTVIFPFGHITAFSSYFLYENTSLPAWIEHMRVTLSYHTYSTAYYNPAIARLELF